ncbi:MAG TPA: serine protease [Terrimicrobiaceae bacterium]
MRVALVRGEKVGWRKTLGSGGFTLLMLLTLLSFNGCAGLMKRGLNSAETMILSTYPLASKRAFGTGFLVAMKDKSARGGLAPAMVTSTHFVKTAGTGAIYMPLRGFDAGGNLSVALLEVVPRRKGIPFYVRHPRLDVAAFRVRIPRGVQLPLLLTLLEEKYLESGSNPRAGEDVAFVGFPEGQSTSLGMFPVLRAGKIASFDQSLFGLRSFLINGDVYPGDSGGPVFRLSKSGQPKVVGMVVERLSIERRAPFPLALAVDAKAIRETLQLLANRDRP